MLQKFKINFFINFLQIAALLLSVINVHAQAPAIQWAKCFGGSGFDNASCIKQTTDGGYISIGSTYSADGNVTVNHGNMDYWVIKLNAQGDIEWQKSFGGSGMEEGRDIQQTSDNGYILIGWSSSADGDVTGNHGDSDYWILKLDNSGNIQWKKCLGGSGNDAGMSIKQTRDGGYIAGGSSQSVNGDVTGHHGFAGQSDCWVVKLNASGNIQWQKSMGSVYKDEFYDIQQTNDNGYILSGFSNYNDGDVTSNKGYYDYWIVKLDSTGIIEWQKNLGGSNSEIAQSIKQTSDGGYITAGYSNSGDGDLTSNHGDYDCWVVKLNSSGNIQWQKNLGGNYTDVANSIQEVNGGGYILSGNSNSIDGDVSGNKGVSDFWVVRLDNSGNIVWQKCLGGNSAESAESIQQTSDLGYIVAGYTASVNNGDVTDNIGGYDFWIVKLGPDLSVVPIDLVSFTAVKENKEVLLNWQTANGINISRFNIQRSSDGSNFLTVGSISVKGDKDYSFTDKDLINTGTFFYRIEILELNGLKHYSNIKEIKNTQEISAGIIFPNPAHEKIVIKGDVKKIIISDHSGRTVISKESDPGCPVTTIYLNRIATGIYFVRCMFRNGEIKIEKLFVE